MIEWRDLEEAFHGPTLERGRQYAKDDRVEQIEVEDDDEVTQISARVYGSEALPYETSVQLLRRKRGVEIEGHCSCPVGYNCKHAAAVLIRHFGLAARPAQQAAAPAPAAAAAAATVPAATRAAAQAAALAIAAGAGVYVHNLWIDRLRALNAPKRAVQQAKQLLYVFDASSPQRGAHPVLTLMTTLLRKDGSRGAMQSANSDLAALLNVPPSYVADENLPLLRELAIAGPRGGVGTGHEMQRNAALLRRLVETGRAAERSQPQQVLRWGATRKGEPRWQLDADGRQRFGIECEPAAAVFVLESFVYIDAARAEAGAVDCDLDPAVAAILMQAPPIAAAEVARVTQALGEVAPSLPGAAPPLPAAIKVESVRTKGVVHLHLENARFTSHYSYQPMRGAVARVAVDYGGLRAALDDTGGTRLRNGALVALTVDQALHRKTLNRLQSAGFLAIDVQGEQREHESTLFADEQLMLDVVENKLPQWRKQGWKITLAEDFSWQPVEVEAYYFDAEPQEDNQWFSLELGVEVGGKRLSLYPVIASLLDDRQLRPLLVEDTPLAPEATIPVRATSTAGCGCRDSTRRGWSIWPSRTSSGAAHRRCANSASGCATSPGWRKCRRRRRSPARCGRTSRRD